VVLHRKQARVAGMDCILSGRALATLFKPIDYNVGLMPRTSELQNVLYRTYCSEESSIPLKLVRAKPAGDNPKGQSVLNS